MKKYGIYGVNRVTKDFLYIFEDIIDIVCCADDESNREQFGGLPVISFSNLTDSLMTNEIDQIIICDFEKEARRKKLEETNFSYGKEFIYEEDLFQILDSYQLNPSGKKMVAWGVGKRAAKLGPFYGLEKFSYFIDSGNRGKHYENTGLAIYLPEEINEWNDIFIVITVADNREIVHQLEQHGLKHYDDYCTMSELLTQPSVMLKRTIFSRDCYNVACHTVLNHVELGQTGSVQVCCVPFVVGEIGNVEANSMKNIWKGIVHKIMCLAVNNRTYSFCNPDLCPVFIKRAKDTPINIEREYPKMEESPRNVLVNFEDSCNLFCESCRKHIKVAEGKELEKNLRYADVLNKEIVPYTEFITMAGTGEVFVGKGYEKMYTSPAMKNVRWFRLLTNGLLFNKKNWEKVYTGKEHAKFILTVSIDAATKETYEALRRNGKFDVLKKNMEFASELRRKGELAYFRLNFVVQRKNYQEMPLFVQWGLDLGVDEVFFTKILNYGTYSQEEFANVSMMELDGMTPKKELKEILDLPIMKEKIVDLGTIRYTNESIAPDYIENYYRWELERKVPTLFTNN